MEIVSPPNVTTITLREGESFNVADIQVERMDGGRFRLTLIHNDGSKPQINTFTGPFTIGQATANGLINYQFN